MYVEARGGRLERDCCALAKGVRVRASDGSVIRIPVRASHRDDRWGRFGPGALGVEPALQNGQAQSLEVPMAVPIPSRLDVPLSGERGARPASSEDPIQQRQCYKTSTDIANTRKIDARTL